MVSTTEWHGERAVVLQNDNVLAVVLPKHGGKIASLYHKQKEFELLFQNPHPTFQKAALGADFSRFEACGFDDAFPTIDACTVSVGGSDILYPDHGEIWSASFPCTVKEESALLAYGSEILPCQYEKRVVLQENGVECRYRIQNTGDFAFPYLWACHCLVNCEDGMELLYPGHLGGVVNVLESPLLGEEGCCWPLSEKFTGLPGQPMTKYYADGKVLEGKCGYVYPKHGLTAVMEFDPIRLPYLGFWCTEGGYRGDCNCAFEPATGYYDNALLAFENQTGSVLQPGEEVSFFVRITFETQRKA